MLAGSSVTVLLKNSKPNSPIFSLARSQHAPDSQTDCPVTNQVMAKFLWSKMTPWLRQDVDQVTHTRGTFEKSPFIAIHIRRGDKIRQNADLWQDAEVRTIRLTIVVEYNWVSWESSENIVSRTLRSRSRFCCYGGWPYESGEE